jgi:hypothetical protein
MEWEQLVRQTHDEVDQERVAKGLPPWRWLKPVGNRPIIQWCASCWVAGDRSLMTKTIAALPVCDTCASVYTGDPEGL